MCGDDDKASIHVNTPSFDHGFSPSCSAHSSPHSSTSSFIYISQSFPNGTSIGNESTEKKSSRSPLVRACSLSLFKSKSTSRNRSNTHPCAPLWSQPPSLHSQHPPIQQSAKPLPPMPIGDDTSEDEGKNITRDTRATRDGLYLQFTHHNETRESTRDRLLRLRQTITAAVKGAGMDSPSGTNLRDNSTSDAAEARRNSLFCGSYGQMKTALSAGGLTSTPCPAEGLEGATRLGALFIAHRLPDGGIEMRKLTLWG